MPIVSVNLLSNKTNNFSLFYNHIVYTIYTSVSSVLLPISLTHKSAKIVPFHGIYMNPRLVKSNNLMCTLSVCS